LLLVFKVVCVRAWESLTTAEFTEVLSKRLKMSVCQRLEALQTAEVGFIEVLLMDLWV
jgi:hypothetical protein